MADDNHSWTVALSAFVSFVNMFVKLLSFFMRATFHTSRSEASFSVSENLGKHFNQNSHI